LEPKVEKLWDKAVSQVLPDRPAKTVYLAVCNSISELPNCVRVGSKYFGLFLAMDARGADVSEIGKVASQLIQRGLGYLCAWGSDCERVHDIFDESSVEKELKENGGMKDSDDVVMTTSHADEPLNEALWFFVHSAFVTEGYEKGCRDWVIATIGNSEWEQEVRSTIRSIVCDPPPN
jgi:hypothetical protein